MEQTVLGIRLGVDRSQYVERTNEFLLEYYKGKYLICWWKETWAFSKGMEGASSASSTSMEKNILLLIRVEE